MSGRLKNPTLTRKQALQEADKTKAREARDWIQRVLGEPVIGEDGDNLHLALKDGVILCKLLNKMFNNCIPKFHPPTALQFQLRENITFFATICKKLGIPEAAIFNVEDLFLGKKMSTVYATLQTLAEMASSKGFPIKWIFLDQMKRDDSLFAGEALAWGSVPDQAPKPKPAPPVSSPVVPKVEHKPVEAPKPVEPKPEPVKKKPTSPEERLQALEAFLARDGNPDKLSPLHIAVQHLQTSDIVDLIIRTRKQEVHAQTTKGYTPLHYAVLHGVPQNVEKLLAAGADINAVAANGDTPLHLAVQRTDDAIIDMLMNAKANIKACNKDGQTALHLAITDGSEETVRKLVIAGAPLNVTDGEGNTPLHLACSVPLSPPTIKLMLDKGADPKAVNKDGNTPLHLAAETGDVEAVTILSKCVTDKSGLNKTNKDGNTALHVATLRGSKSIAQKLVAMGADVNAQNKANATALQLAVEEDSTEMVEMIMTAPKVELNSKTNDGRTPLYTASWRGNIDAVRALIKGGANPNIQNKEGWSPLHAACGKGHLDVVQELLRANAYPNIQDNQGTTPLYHACDKKCEDVALFLLSVPGVDVNASAKDCWKPIHAAARRNLLTVCQKLISFKPDLKATVKECQHYGILHFVVMASKTPSIEMLTLLINSGADVNQQNEHGMTPLHLACCVDAKYAVKFLVENAHAKLDIKNTNGRRPLEVACYFGFEETATFVARKMGKKKPPKMENHSLSARSMDDVQPQGPPTPEDFEKHI